MSVTGTIFDLDTFAVHDGPGIRMAVYFKGCPLNCGWCHSPESRRSTPDVIFVHDRCSFCGSCAAVCEHDVHNVSDASHELARDRCTLCGKCVQHCPTWALQVKGQSVPADEIVEKARHLKPFFDHSHGGVTLTGGEVTLQPDFAEAVLAGCKAAGIHTAIETCGACDWERLERLLRHSDLVLYDLKLMDDPSHRTWTGSSNRQILKNARRLASCGVQVQVRVPLIPAVTDTVENLGAIFAFMKEVGLREVALLPFNPSTAAKYEWLGLPYELDVPVQEAEQLARMIELAQKHGVNAAIG